MISPCLSFCYHAAACQRGLVCPVLVAAIIILYLDRYVDTSIAASRRKERGIFLSHLANVRKVSGPSIREAAAAVPQTQRATCSFLKRKSPKPITMAGIMINGPSKRIITPKLQSKGFIDLSSSNEIRGNKSSV